MAYQRIMALEVFDDEIYQQYRNNMMQILHKFGGQFGFDFTINQVLKSKTDNPINRVFTIDFPSKAVMDNFFSDASYLAVKAKYFNRSVSSVTTISMHDTPLESM